MTQIMVAVRAGFVTIAGQRRMVRKGRTTAHADHWIVTDHPTLWGPMKVDYPTPVPTDDAWVAPEFWDRVPVAEPGDLPDILTELGDAPPSDAPLPDIPAPEARRPVWDKSSGNVHALPVVAEPDPAAVRVWAAGRGMHLSSRGRLPAAAVAAYREAHDG